MSRVSSLHTIMGVLFSAVSTVGLQADDPAKFNAIDVFELEYASSPQVSPDGKQILYSRRSNDIMTDSTRSNLWIINRDGTDHRPVLSGTDNYRNAVWSPSGDRIAYVASTSGGSQIHVRYMDTGQTALVTNVRKSPGSLTWSPDGKTIAFTMSVDNKKATGAKLPPKPKGAKWAPPVKVIDKARYHRDGRGIIDPAFTHIFTVPATGGTARQITSGDFNHYGSLSWTADSKTIYFAADRHPDWEYRVYESDIYAVSTDTGELTQITDEPGSERAPVLSPSGKKLAYIKSNAGRQAYRIDRLFVADSDGGNAKGLTEELDRKVRNAQWDKDKGLYFQYIDRANVKVAYTNLSGNHRIVLEGLGGTSLGRPYSSGDYDVKNGTVAFTLGKADRPADLAVHYSGRVKQVTELNEDLLGYKTLGKTHELVYQSSFDGEEIQGWYVTPPNYDPTKAYPVILEIHGGPHLSYGPNFTAEIQRMAAEGYVVFFANHRGSASYGERFARLLEYKYSSKEDFADHMSGLDKLIEMGVVDGSQMYITGGSAGGIASAYAIGLTDRFRAAVVAKPVINWLSKPLTADSYLSQIPNQFKKLPWEDPMEYWERSPLSLVGNVVTPTMLITGEEDRRTPISETEQFYQALKLRRIDTVMVRVPGSPHGIAGKPSRLIAKVENMLGWFAKYAPKND
ncbi:acyl-peptide hydrolase [Kordiimonas sediminis]|uniref:Acyl-peptide hydrolase n=1 Tax=Kordiimonas sediminis TaxID=1735581 RepID=A0A919EAP5_9PROT|nr:S9 family peptidase [Kordiimonas sediminis]GHF30825.1 acyl-peptide hydrolase [Kordiimonas sediminis]